MHWVAGNWPALAEDRPVSTLVKCWQIIGRLQRGLVEADSEEFQEAFFRTRPRAGAIAALVSSLHHSIARSYHSIKYSDEMERHFEASSWWAMLGSDLKAPKLRGVSDLIESQLFDEASNVIASQVETEQGNSPELVALRSEVELLVHQLSLLQKRWYENPQGRNAVSQSYSQLGQDTWVLEKLGFKKGGYFVEFGATDGILLSNSYLLEKHYEWNGLLAEPNPVYFESLIRNRQCEVTTECIAGRSGMEMNFLLANEYGGLQAYFADDDHQERRRSYAKLGGVIKLKTISLDAFLKKYNAPRSIDYLSIDTEGSEYEILKSFPLDEWDIKCITVEHNYQEQMQQNVRNLLCSKGYTVEQVKWDDWFFKPVQD